MSGGSREAPTANLWFGENLWDAPARCCNLVARMNPGNGAVTEFDGKTDPMAAIGRMTVGPDGNIWFLQQYANRISRITPAGVVTEFTTPIFPGAGTGFIVAGGDGNLWFTIPYFAYKAIGRITPSGVVTIFSHGILGTTNSIAGGADGNVWFSEDSIAGISRITPSGAVTRFLTSSWPNMIARGPDQEIWFVMESGRTGKVTPAGLVTEFDEGIGAQYSRYANAMVTGPDGSLWIAGAYYGIFRITINAPIGAPVEVPVASHVSLFGMIIVVLVLGLLALVGRRRA